MEDEETPTDDTPVGEMAGISKPFEDVKAFDFNHPDIIVMEDDGDY